MYGENMANMANMANMPNMTKPHTVMNHVVMVTQATQ